MRRIGVFKHDAVNAAIDPHATVAYSGCFDLAFSSADLQRAVIAAAKDESAADWFPLIPSWFNDWRNGLADKGLALGAHFHHGQHRQPDRRHDAGRDQFRPPRSRRRCRPGEAGRLERRENSRQHVFDLRPRADAQLHRQPRDRSARSRRCPTSVSTKPISNRPCSAARSPSSSASRPPTSSSSTARPTTSSSTARSAGPRSRRPTCLPAAPRRRLPRWVRASNTKPAQGVTAFAAIFNGTASDPGPGDPQLRDHHGLAFRVRDDPWLIGQVQFDYAIGSVWGPLAGAITPGAWYHTGSFRRSALRQ